MNVRGLGGLALLLLAVIGGWWLLRPTPPPTAEAPWRNFRRLTLAITSGAADDSPSIAIALLISKGAFMPLLLSHPPPA